MKILLGSSNRGKTMEMKEALSSLPIILLSPEDLGLTAAPLEHGQTFEENATLKARFFHEQGKMPTIADDSGILVEALQNELGIHTRRWGAGPDATDQEWIEFFLQRMNRESNRRAHFHCAIAYIDPDGALHSFSGDCQGMITETLEAEYLPGLPISACFKPDGSEHVYSALSIDEKNRVSHRGKALAQLRSFLERDS